MSKQGNDGCQVHESTVLTDWLRRNLPGSSSLPECAVCAERGSRKRLHGRQAGLCERLIFFSDRVRLPRQEKACDLEDLLARRKDDLLFLEQEKRHVESLLRQFGRVKHLVEGAHQEWY